MRNDQAMRAFPLHSSRTVRLVLALVLCAAIASIAARAAEPRPTPSGLPVPRFVSLKEERVNVREGPSKDHRVLWIYTRKGLPVEIIAEHDIWRRIRDKDGSTGWVHGNLLDGRRAVIVEGVALVALREEPEADGRPVAWAEPGVVLKLKKCVPVWCEVEGGNSDGWIERARLWGLYPDEIVK
jgi:SH3-like domain-containing protein